MKGERMRSRCPLDVIWREGDRGADALHRRVRDATREGCKLVCVCLLAALHPCKGDLKYMYVDKLRQRGVKAARMQGCRHRLGLHPWLERQVPGVPR